MQKAILNLFTKHHTLQFSEIEKSLKTRSNKLAYHLNQLVAKQKLSKEQRTYKLKEEQIIPYLSEKRSPLPVILIHIGNKKQSFLPERTKRPYKGKQGLPGGRIRKGESLALATKRIMKEKHDIKATLSTVHSVSLEHLNNTHSFILIFVSATTKENIQLTNITKNKTKIIKSDHHILTEHLNKEIEIPTITSRA